VLERNISGESDRRNDERFLRKEYKKVAGKTPLSNRTSHNNIEYFSSQRRPKTQE
jgi:hypothetical protein